MKLIPIEPVVESLSQGPLLRKLLALALRILAVVAAFSGLFFVLSLVAGTIDVISYNVPQAMGMLIALVIELLIFFLAVKVLLFRAKSVLICSVDEYPMINLSSLIFKTIGELLTLFYSGLGLIAGILIWFGGDYSAVPEIWRFLLFPAPPFVLGLIIIIASQIFALLILAAMYLLAELLLLFRDIAVNTRK